MRILCWSVPRVCFLAEIVLFTYSLLATDRLVWLLYPVVYGRPFIGWWQTLKDSDISQGAVKWCGPTPCSYKRYDRELFINYQRRSAEEKETPLSRDFFSMGFTPLVACFRIKKEWAGRWAWTLDIFSALGFSKSTLIKNYKQMPFRVRCQDSIVFCRQDDFNAELIYGRLSNQQLVPETGDFGYTHGSIYYLHTCK